MSVNLKGAILFTPIRMYLPVLIKEKKLSFELLNILLAFKNAYRVPFKTLLYILE